MSFAKTLLFHATSIILVLLLILINPTLAFANNPQLHELRPIVSESSAPLSISKTNQSSADRLVLIELLQKQNAKLSEKVNLLENDLKKQTELIENLSNQNESMDYAQWSSIMLASVALILTVLGIVLAVFSFIGYQKVLDSAKATATEVAGKEVVDKIHETTKSELENLFSKQAMSDSDSNEYKKLEPIRKFLLDAVAKVIYRGISLNEYESNSSTRNEQHEL